MTASIRPALLLALAAVGLAASAPAWAQGAAPTAPTAPPAAAGPAVTPLTVRPQTEPKGTVISSTEATSLAAPNFSARDAQPQPMATTIAPGAALGRQPAPTGSPAGILNTNPDLPGGYRTTDVGVTKVF